MKGSTREYSLLFNPQVLNNPKCEDEEVLLEAPTLSLCTRYRQLRSTFPSEVYSKRCSTISAWTPLFLPSQNKIFTPRLTLKSRRIVQNVKTKSILAPTLSPCSRFSIKRRKQSTRYSQLCSALRPRYTQEGVALFQPEPPFFYHHKSSRTVELLTY